MADLSPAAAAIWDAFNDVSERVGVFEDYGDALAAALRAAADAVAPKDVPEMHNCCHELLESVHEHLNEIAAELDSTITDTPTLPKEKKTKP